MSVYRVRITDKLKGKIRIVYLRPGDNLPFRASYCKDPKWPYSTSNGKRWKIETLEEVSG